MREKTDAGEFVDYYMAPIKSILEENESADTQSHDEKNSLKLDRDQVKELRQTLLEKPESSEKT